MFTKREFWKFQNFQFLTSLGCDPTGTQNHILRCPQFRLRSLRAGDRMRWYQTVACRVNGSWANKMDLDLINKYCLRINDFMLGMFRGIGIKLIDFKLEFGRVNTDGKKEIILADEISPDTCRLWDVVSEKKLDKDRFRKDLGNIIQAYQEVARRLGIFHEESNISEVKFGKPKVVNIKKK